MRSTSGAKVIGQVFGAPLVVKGRTWFPYTELGVWLLMAWLSGKGRPDRSIGERLGVGALTAAVLLGSEWGHNLAHAAAATRVGKPMDALKVTWGMPLVIYHDINDRTVSPRQHILRALGGPAFNAAVLPFALLLRRFSRPRSAARDAANVAVGMNLFLCSASLLPIPGIDGGPILKWTLVEKGFSVSKADETVKKVDRALGAGLGAAAGVALKKQRKFLGVILGLFAGLALAVGLGWIKE
jgi:Zn-dependent protease